MSIRYSIERRENEERNIEKVEGTVGEIFNVN